MLVIASSCDLAVSLSNLDGGCPPMQGAVQVKITSVPPGASPFCIDSTEVTNAQYAQFLSALPNAGIPGAGDAGRPGAVPDGCEEVTSATPSEGWPYQSGYDEYPVTNVNWCQAYAYCAWAGKNLCGQIRGPDSDGGALPTTKFTDPTLSEWFDACSMGGTRTYPYGKSYEPVCEGAVDGSAGLQPVRYNPSCVGGFPGVYDMSGNVWEWTNVCAGPGPGQTEANVFCYTMGGGFDSTSTTDLSCVGERNWTRTAGMGDIGIRCCLDL
jgi:formylglycine-generating enzyme